MHTGGSILTVALLFLTLLTGGHGLAHIARSHPPRRTRSHGASDHARTGGSPTEPDGGSNSSGSPTTPDGGSNSSGASSSASGTEPDGSTTVPPSDGEQTPANGLPEPIVNADGTWSWDEGGDEDEDEEEGTKTASETSADAEKIPSEYTPNANWRYYFEAVRARELPECRHRFVRSQMKCTGVDLSTETGEDEGFELVPAEEAGDRHFYIKNKCGTYITYSQNCRHTRLKVSNETSDIQQFEFVQHNWTELSWKIVAVNRAGCQDRYLSYPTKCTQYFPDTAMLGEHGAFRLFPISSNRDIEHTPISDTPCVDPYAWYSSADKKYYLLCSGSDIELLSSNQTDGPMNPSTKFEPLGMALNQTNTLWAHGTQRQAPENVQFDDSFGTSKLDVMLFSVDQDNESGVHRIGWAMTDVTDKMEPRSWNHFAGGVLDLGQAPGGESDPSIFRDSDSKTYLLWKTNDEFVGDNFTRIWVQEIMLQEGEIAFHGERVQVMNSTGLWWARGATEGSYVVEAPRIIYSGGQYYLFFSAGHFCGSGYSEGVARSQSVWGPYQKMQVPLLSTALVGTTAGRKLYGPGHASFVEDPYEPGIYNVFFHAHHDQATECILTDSTGYVQPTRNSPMWTFVMKMHFCVDGWPYVDFNALRAPPADPPPESTDSGNGTAAAPLERSLTKATAGNASEAADTDAAASSTPPPPSADITPEVEPQS